MTTMTKHQPTALPRWQLIGPGLVAAATGVGAGDLVATLVAGSLYGYQLIWAAVLGCLLKIILVEGVGRWTLASGHTIFHGWRSLGRWASVYFGIYIVLWGFVYGATAMSSTALPLAALFPAVDLKIFAVASGLLGLALVWLGSYAVFERIIAALVGMMFVAVVGSALMTGPNLTDIARGLVPRLPQGSLFYVLGLAGGVGGSITLAAYGYWIREKGWRQPGWMRVMRLDNSVAYVMTGIFVVAMLIVGAELLYSANIAIAGGSRGLLDLAGVLESRYGSIWSIIFLLGFWASSFSSLLGVWHGVSLMFADFVAHWLAAKEDPAKLGAHSEPVPSQQHARWYMLWLTFPSMALLFMDRPFMLIVGYGVLGALFMPFLAITLLLLLNRSSLPREWRNGWLSNGLLAMTCVIFGALGLHQLLKLF
ncbi:divalent metal cation transporter [Aestuariicella hydrocarbonica]|uniref:Divalent metal cation transporter n=1 Tax=Pseudomaricurvus hydrocarbonicus TaxID=1470433 RepID=A0A9E5JVT7_9GAMM|nr:Nramp family divalent metal transporter [Aestuariicella hydrocarbonica]NHO66169.1 divalent metal cation transporter [Aestuariicella hydrocarbonica]